MRAHIDRIDAEMLRLLTKRLEYAVRTRRFKETVTDPSREQQVLNSIKDNSRWLIRPEFSQKLFTDIISESRSVQALPTKLVGFQGEHGALTELALTTYASDWLPIPYGELADVFEGVQNGTLDYGVMPVENSVEGSIAQAFDRLIGSELQIIGEIVLPVHYCLLTLPETDHRELKVAYSHPEVLSHCRGFLSRNKLEGRPFHDASGAALMLVRERPTASAVIASKLCANIYNLNVLMEAVEDHKENATRFVILSREKAVTRGSKCSIVFTTSHTAGSLFSILKIFSDAGINLTRIESRPIPENPRTVAFVLDFSGSTEDSKVKNVLEKVQDAAATFRLLGCYDPCVISGAA